MRKLHTWCLRELRAIQLEMTASNAQRRLNLHSKIFGMVQLEAAIWFKKAEMCMYKDFQNDLQQNYYYKTDILKSGDCSVPGILSFNDNMLLFNNQKIKIFHCVHFLPRSLKGSFILVSLYICPDFVKVMFFVGVRVRRELNFPLQDIIYFQREK